MTARVSQDTEHFLLNPFGGQITTNYFETFLCVSYITFENIHVFSFLGMMYNEITASSLVKVNMQGEVVEEGTTNFGVNQVQSMILDT